MISRKRCKQIAQTWVMEQGAAEWQRRLDSIKQSDKALAELAAKARKPWITPDRSVLISHGTSAMLGGYYDPPLPKIPNLFQRLRMDDWTPPMPTQDES